MITLSIKDVLIGRSSTATFRAPRTRSTVLMRLSKRTRQKLPALRVPAWRWAFRSLIRY